MLTLAYACGGAVVLVVGAVVLATRLVEECWRGRQHPSKDLFFVRVVVVLLITKGKKKKKLWVHGLDSEGSEETLQRCYSECIQSVFRVNSQSCLALFAINTAPHATTKCFPFYLPESSRPPEYIHSPSVAMRIAVRSRFSVFPRFTLHFYFQD